MVTTNTFKLTTGEVIKTMQDNLGNRMEQLKRMKPEQLDKIIKDNARGIAEKKLLLEAVDDLDISVTQAEVDSVLTIQYNKAGGKERFTELLAKNNLDIKFYEQDVRSTLLIQHYLDQVITKDIEVSEAEIMGEYDKSYTGDRTATVRHILLLTQDKSEQEKQKIRKKMEGILAEARSGKDFAELAKKYSEDRGSKDKGGIYEDFEKGAMVKPFEDAAFSVPIGEISNIVETQYGYHILKVIDRKKSDQTLEEVRQDIIDKIRQPKKGPAYNKHIQGLKDAAGFKIVVG
jgi:parvulin-like peptidyl-prolyl isomerase